MGFLKQIRSIGNALGLILVAASLFFVAGNIRASQAWNLDHLVIVRLSRTILLNTVLYALSCFLLSLAWQRLLNWCGETTTPRRYYHAIYGRSQIAKYIPGNVFHFVGRHVMGRTAGLSHGSLAWAALLEISGCLIAGVTLGGISLLAERGLGPVALMAVGVAAGVLVLSLVWRPLQKHISFLQLPSRTNTNRVGLMHLPLTLVLYAAFFFANGFILRTLAQTVVSGPIDDGGPGTFTAVVAAAWVGGLIVPGASAGIGVREAALVLSLSAFLGEYNSTIVAIAFRVVTVMGDLVFFLLTVLGRITLCRRYKTSDS